MDKAVISNRIYLSKPEEGFDSIKKALTYKLETRIPDRRGKMVSSIEIIRNYKMLPRDILSIPQGRIDLIPEGCEIIDKRVYNDMPYPEPKLPLRPEQQVVVDSINDSCLINALVGWGKTFAALHLAKKLGQKTLVVTHTTMLRDQWIAEIETLFGISAGKIGSGVFDIDSAIVVGNVQTVTKHSLALAKEFGTVIIDECLDYETQIQTLEHGKIKIGVLVNSKMPVHVLSMNPDTSIVEYKKVLNWYKNKHTNCLKISHSGGGSLKCTHNHNIYTYNNGQIYKVPAETLKVGDYLLQALGMHKSTHIINQVWKPILLGLLLGDGSLKYDNPRSNSCRLSITHGEKQQKYLDWKKELLNNDLYITNGISGYCSNSTQNITTKSFVDLDGWYKEIYRDGSKKIISKTIASLLTKESWAIMYQDNGNSSKVSDSIVFSFCGFDLDSCNNLGQSLKTNFNIKTPVVFTCNKGYNYIRLNKEDTILFKKDTASLIHPSMYYKLNKLDTNNLVFNFPIPAEKIFNEFFSVRTVTDITEATLTGNHRYNIEVEDNHTYFANGILVANCHHIPATTFNDIIDALYARYRIGLSGTTVRKDGKHVLFKDYFGGNILKPPQSHTLDPKVKIVKSGVALTPGATWVQKINNLLYDPDYQEFIAVLAARKIHDGHSVLLVADRVDFLIKVKELLGETCMLVTGATTFEERQQISEQIESGEKMCIAGSRQIFAEGISINRLSCVILATPIANESLLEQIVGRIMRKHDKKLPPEVIDINFSGPADRKQNNLRLGFFLNKGWEVSGL